MMITIHKDNRSRKYLKHNLPRGFALVELLVAIAIFSVVVTVINTTLYTGIKAYHKIQIQLRLNQELNQILDKLSTELRNCYDAEYNQTENKGGFIADSQSISFFTIQNVYSQGSFKKLLARINYNFKDGKLFKKMQVDKDAFLDEGNFQEEELLSDIGELSFQYLYYKQIPQGEDKYEWKPEWEDKGLIPQGIKIELVRYDPNEDISVSLKRHIFIAQGQIPTQQ